MKKNIFIIAIILGLAGSAGGFAQSKNNGTLVISNNFNYVVRNFDFINNGTVIIKNNGKLILRDGDLENNGAFGSLTETGQVRFEGNGTDQEIRGSVEPNIYELVTAQTGAASVIQTIDVSTYKLTVNDADNLFDYKVQDPAGSGLKLVADEFTLNGNVRLYDDSQILQNTNTIVVNGTGKIFRDQMGTGNKYWYNYWSSPVNINGEWKASYLMDGRNPDNPYGVKFDYAYTAVGSNQVYDRDTAYINDAWIYTLPNGTNSYASWVWLGRDGTVTPGQGYTMKGPNIFNASRPGSTEVNQFKAFTFAGAPNGGTYTFPLDDEHITLLGNPYLSALDANQFIQDNDGKFNGTIYFWEHVDGDSHVTREYVGGYAAYNSSGGVRAMDWQTLSDTIGTKIPGRYIPVAQGFILYNDTGSNNTITFQNSQRAYFKEDGSNSVFMRPTESLTDIRVIFSNPNGLTRELLLAVRPSTTEGFDWSWDGPFLGFGGYSDMSFLINGGDYIIQAVPQITENTRLPLHITAKENGTYKIGISEWINFPETLQIYVEDAYTGETIEISPEQNYYVYLNEGDYPTRFALVFRPSSNLNAEDELAGNFGIYYHDGYVYITNPEGLQVETATVYDLTGKMVISRPVHSTEPEIKIPVSLKTGIYLMQVQSEGKQLTRKFIVE